MTFADTSRFWPDGRCPTCGTPAAVQDAPVRRPRELLAEIELARQEGWRDGLSHGWKQGRANALEEVETERAANAAAPQEDAPLRWTLQWNRLIAKVWEEIGAYSVAICRPDAELAPPAELRRALENVERHMGAALAEKDAALEYERGMREQGVRVESALNAKLAETRAEVERYRAAMEVLASGQVSHMVAVQNLARGVLAGGNA